MTSHSTLFARQPIYGPDLRVAGYEVLFRRPNAVNAEVEDSTSATADVVTRAMLDIGFETLVGEHRAWINPGRDFLVRRAFESLPAEQVVLEVLETVEDDAEVCSALREARAAGFSIALDDFVLHENSQHLVELSDFIKLDCLGKSPDELRESFAAFAKFKGVLLAEKVESRETVDICRAAGARLFQGYFFTRPEPVMGVEIRGNRVQLLRVLAELNNEDVSVQRLVELVQLDVSLAYRRCATPTPPRSAGRACSTTCATRSRCSASTVCAP